jgi:NAD(P)-dependent dehydrogenase (short-subunit alcohol dehydrogenase family)
MPTVLVTGASRGIGRASVLRLARAGWDVYAGVRSEADGAVLAAEAPGVTPVVLDVTDADQVAALDDALPEQLDAVVNNAGVVVAAPVEALGLDDLRAQLEVNVIGQVAVTQAVLPRLRASRGRVVFVSSISGRYSAPFMGAYSASKFALEALADALRLELRPWGVAVSLIEPGAIDTDLWRNAQDTAQQTEAAMTSEHRRLYAGHISGMRKLISQTQRRTASVEKVAAVIQRAVTSPRPRARYVVGLDARAQLALGAALPTSAHDAAVARAAGVPRDT